MKESDPEIAALAEAWASVDGKSARFLNDADTKDGYLSDALGLAEALRNRGFFILHEDEMFYEQLDDPKRRAR